MSLYNIIPLIIIIVSLAGIIFIIVRKFPVLAAIDMASIQKEREADKKDKIIISRLERKISGVIKKTVLFLRPFFSAAKKWFKKIYNQILEWEKSYVAKKPGPPITPEAVEQKVKGLFFAAEERWKEGKLDEAEKKYVEIISLDYKNTDAYKKLGVIYSERKDYDHAYEIFQHILKLNPNDVETLLGLCLLHKQKGENEKALICAESALGLEPANPRVLDFLIEMSIIVGNKVLAEETLEKLRAANPENQKLGEFRERIGAIG